MAAVEQRLVAHPGRSAVRTLRLAVAISATVHVAAVVGIASQAHPPRSEPAVASVTPIEVVYAPAPAPPTPPTPPPAAPIDVAIVDEPPAPATAQPRQPAGRSPAPPSDPGRAAITVPGRGSAEQPPPLPERRPTLAMRHGELPRPVLPSGRWDALDHVPRGTAPEKDQTTGILEPSGGGTQRSDQGVFVAKVNPDGTVKLTDSPNLHVHLALPSREAIGNGLRAWYDSDKGTFGERADTSLSSQIQVTSGAPTDQPDTVTTRLKDRAPTAVVPVLGGGFDATDWLMRRNGGDPYASRKLAMLDATRDERAQIGGRHTAQQLKRAPELMQRNLETLWTATRDPQARKQALFELWDECAETGDPKLVEAAQIARRMVIGFIRARLPAGSPGAFTPAELAAIARAKQSKAAFVPYE